MELLVLWSTLCVLIIIFATLVYDSYMIVKKDNKVVSDHRKDHILIYSVFTSGYLWVLWEFILPCMDTYLIKEGMSYGLVLMNTGIVMLFKHLYMELPHG